MTAGQTVYDELLRECCALFPIEFYDSGFIETPMFEVFAHTQWTDYFPNAAFQLFDRMIVQVVPMVVGNNEVVDVWHVVGRIDFCRSERFVDERYGRSHTEHRVYQYTFFIDLQ